LLGASGTRCAQDAVREARGASDAAVPRVGRVPDAVVRRRPTAEGRQRVGGRQQLRAQQCHPPAGVPRRTRRRHLRPAQGAAGRNQRKGHPRQRETGQRAGQRRQTQRARRHSS